MNEAKKFLVSQGAFRCEKLRAVITPKECLKRQKRQLAVLTIYGVRVTKHNSDADKFCRSGTCSIGNVVKKTGRAP